MKQFLAFLSLFLIAIGLSAQSFTVDGLTYSVLSTTDKTVKVSNGENATGDVVVPETVNYNDVEYSVTTIGNRAFYNNKNITSISLTSVTTLDSWSFYGCSSLSSVSLLSATSIGSDAFSGCSSLASVSLPSANSIGNNAFENCSSLASISLLSVTSIGVYAFYGCDNICSLRIGSVEQWCNVEFNKGFFDDYYSNPLVSTHKLVDLYIGDSENPAKAIEIPASITELAAYAFKFTNITSVSAPSVTTIGNDAFFDCTSLVSISFPKVTTIGDRAIYGCQSLENVDFPSAESIGSYAFDGCSLSSIYLPSAISIGDHAFSSCFYLSKVSLPLATSIGEYAFEGWYNGSNYTSELMEVSLPSATKIGGHAFMGCSNISHLDLPEVEEVGTYAFDAMTKLKYIALPKVKKIGDRTFYGVYIDSLRIGSVQQYLTIEYENSDINSWTYQHNFPFQSNSTHLLFIGDSNVPATEITIPASVQNVPDYAFIGTSIHTIHFEGTNPPALMNTRSFPAWTMLAVPDEAYETYLAADEYKTIPLQITKEGYITKVVEVEAVGNTSKVLEKIGEDNARYVVNLTVKGTINSYDMLIIRNQMTSLRNLDLTDARIVDCDYVYSNTNGINYHSVKDVITADWMNALMNVKLPATTKTIDNNAFNGCKKLVSVNIPDGVTSIGNYAFSGCNRINDLTLPQSVTSFGQFAFSGCTGLKEVVIPDGVISVNSYAFYNSALKKVTIPKSVKSIGGGAFGACSISLRISDIDSWKDVVITDQSIGNVFGSVETLYIGDSDEAVENLVIPAGTKELKNYTFSGFRCLKNISLPDELTTIGMSTFSRTGLTKINLPKNLHVINNYAFYQCSDLEDIEFADSLKHIGSEAFAYCTKLKNIELPSYLETIGSHAFVNCSKLSEILIPASITEIKDYAFQGCSNLNTVIATTVEPIAINENTFSTYRTATMYSPKTSYYKYYWNTQWNQFLARKEYDKEFAESYGYKYFYLNGKNGDNFEDFVIDDATGPLHGVIDPEFGYPPVMKAPDADFNEGAGIVVGGEQIQELGDIHLHHNGNNGASIIAKAEGKVHIDNLYVDIKVQPNRWYFFCFPFDINPGEAKFGGSHVWYLYDGEARAMNGNGGWKKVAADGVMKSGYGYIFQGAVNGTLSIHVADLTIDASDRKTNMITYQSENKNDASWNLVGNSNPAYYGINDLMLGEVPVTVYDNETGNYVAVRPGDDDYEFYPFQAFFVQKPEGIATMDFDAAKQETKNMADKSMAVRARARAAKKVDSARKIINLEIASINASADSVASAADRTRIVLNPKKSINYESDCDAAKFIADKMPQIYSLDNEGCAYAINERPVENGVISIAVQVPEEGFYTISASRLDSGAKLRDLETGSEVDLAKGGYTFGAKAMTYTNRFQLILSDGATSITTPEEAMDIIAVETGAISVKDASADVKVYSVGGILVASQKGAGNMKVPAGVYVVNVNGQSVKVTVNE